MRFGIKTLASLCAALIPLLSAQAHANTGNWPERPISLVVPYPAGGTTDIVGRQLAKLMQEELGQTVVVENKAGAATAIGTSSVARSNADGYTLLISAGTTFTTNPHMQASLPYKLEDFVPVSAVVSVPFAFVVRQDFPAKNIEEFVSYAKANPKKINNATNGQGSMVHLLGELAAKGLGVEMTQVHYRGAAPAAVDLMAGVVDSNIEALTNAVPNIEAGKYRALAVLSPERLGPLPDVPTFNELGYPSIMGESWFAIFAPAGTPEPIVNKLNQALKKITASEEYQTAMRNMGNEPRYSTSEELLRLTQEQKQAWGDLIQTLNLSPQ